MKEGQKVTIITCAPNFPSGKLLYPYKNWLWQREVIDGVHVIRVWTFITSNSGFILRTLDYVSYMIMSLLASPFVRKVDLIVGTSPQFFTVVAAFLSSRLKGCPFVFELRDLWPASIKAVGAMDDSYLLKLLERLEMFLYRKANLIVSVTKSFKYELVKRGIDKKKIEVITNGVDLTRFGTRPRDKALLSDLNLKDFFLCGYIGTHGMAHNLDTLLDAAEILQNSNQSNFKLLFLGDGACKVDLVQKANDRGLENVIFLNSVPKDEVARYWSILDVSIIHLRKDDLFKTVIPSKIFESVAMGIPLIHAVEGESAEIVEKNKCGKCISPEDAPAMAEAILELKTKSNDYKAYQSSCNKMALKFDRNKLAIEMLEILENYVLKK